MTNDNDSDSGNANGSRHGPKLAEWRFDCDGCGMLVETGDPMYFPDDEATRYCLECAIPEGIVCPQCEKQKKRRFPECYECGTEEV